MARYTYNASLVSETIDTLNSACKTLDNTNVDIKKGINMICNARGVENMNIDFSPITGYQSQVIDVVDEMRNELIKKSKEIEEYENAPWYKKLFATIGMGALKIIEGFIAVNENVIDGHVALVGWIGGIFSSKFQDSCGEFIKKDWVGDTTAKWYEEGWLKNVNKYSAMSHQSTAANVLKGVGNAVGYVALSCIPYVGFIVSTAAATMGAIGSGTQAGLQEGMSYNQAFGKGAKQGAVALATSLITKGIGNKLSGAGNAVTNSLDDVGRAASTAKNTFTGLKSVLANGGDDIAALLDDAAGALDDVANFADDALLSGGTTAQTASAAFKSAKNLTSTLDKLKTAAQAAGYGDDIINSIDEMAAAAKTTQSAANAAKNLIANTSSVTNGKFGEAVKNVGSKIPGAKAVTSTVGKIAANPTVQKAVTTLSTATQAVAKASPAITSAVSTTAGVVASGTLGDNQTSTAYRQFIEESQNVSSAVSLANDAQQNVQNGKPTIATDAEAQQNLQNLQNQGFNPGSSSTETTYPVESTGTTTPSATPTSQSSYTPSSSTGSYNVSVDPIEMPTYPNGSDGTTGTNTQNTTPSTNTDNGQNYRPNEPDNTTNNYPTTEDIVSNVVIDNKPTDNNIPSSSKIDSLATDTNVSKQTTSDNVLNTFGDVSSSVSGLSTKTNVPTSSSPLFSENGTSKSTLVPLGAGLGAASIAGIGAKAYLDKREKSDDDIEELETEDWTNQENMEFDYGLDEALEEADYLSPTDELAFTE